MLRQSPWRISIGIASTRKNLLLVEDPGACKARLRGGREMELFVVAEMFDSHKSICTLYFGCEKIRGDQMFPVVHAPRDSDIASYDAVGTVPQRLPLC